MKNIGNIYMLAYFHDYYFLESTWHVMFSHAKFQIGINICHVMSSNVSELSHTRLAQQMSKVDEQLSSVRPDSLKRKKQREENDGNCKAFCVTRKRNSRCK